MQIDDLSKLLPSYRAFSIDELKNGTYLQKEPDTQLYDALIAPMFTSLQETFDTMGFKYGKNVEGNKDIKCHKEEPRIDNDKSSSKDVDLKDQDLDSVKSQELSNDPKISDQRLNVSDSNSDLDAFDVDSIVSLIDDFHNQNSKPHHESNNLKNSTIDNKVEAQNNTNDKVCEVFLEKSPWQEALEQEKIKAREYGMKINKSNYDNTLVKTKEDIVDNHTSEPKASLQERMSKILEPFSLEIKFLKSLNFQEQYQIIDNSKNSLVLMVFYKANNKISNIRFNKTLDKDQVIPKQAVLELQKQLIGTSIS